MVLDFVTYVSMMGFFAGFVLLNDENTFDWAEIVFAFYVCVSAPFGVFFRFAFLNACVCGFDIKCVRESRRCFTFCQRHPSIRLVRGIYLNTRVRSRGASTTFTI